MFDKNKYSADYNRSNYDQIKIYAPIGYKARIKELAALKGQSMAQWIISAIDSAIQEQEDNYTRRP